MRFCNTFSAFGRFFLKTFYEKPKIGYQNYCRFLGAQRPELAPFSQEDSDEFMSYFPLIVEDLTVNQTMNDIKDVTQRFATCLQNNVPNGKRVRGLTTLITYKIIEKPENLNSESIKLANILGWCTELVEAALIIYDDLMDNSLTRRHSICWHRQEGVGFVAISDAIGLNSSAYIILKKYLRNHRNYINIFEFFQTIIFNTTFGQTMDSIRYRADQISMDKFKKIAKYKTGFYTFYYPVVLGVYLAKGYHQEVVEEQVAPILFKMGEYFQVKNDMNDCWAKEDVAGKSGTDIECSKCTWLAARALQKASPVQKKLFEQNYGRTEIESIRAIRDLYRELEIMEDYKEYERNFFESIKDENRKIKEPYNKIVSVLNNKLEKQLYKTVIN